MMTMEGMLEGTVVEDIIRRLLEGGRGGKQVKLSEAEIRQLCVNARHLFLTQRNLLHLRAPLKICGPSLSLSLWISFIFYLILIYHQYFNTALIIYIFTLITSSLVALKRPAKLLHSPLIRHP